jgi:ureidoacrylate peracid hydrolase
MHQLSIPEYIVRRVIERRGKLHVYERLEPSSTALLVVDLQNVYVLPGMPLKVPAAREILGNVNRLAGAVRRAGGVVVWLQITAAKEDWPRYFERMGGAFGDAVAANLIPGTHGHDLFEGLDVRPEDLRVEKTRYSAFIQGASDLDAQLRRRGVDTIVVAGTLTNVCCEATVRDAMMLNYWAVLVSDANAALSDEEHNLSLANVLSTFGRRVLHRRGDRCPGDRRGEGLH